MLVRYDGIVVGDYAVHLLVEGIVLDLLRTAALCVFCVFCGSIFFPVGQPALRGIRANVHRRL
jgi:hypothetical protein